MDNDDTHKENSKKNLSKFVEEQKHNIEKFLSKKEKKERKKDTRFKKGNTIGIRFGAGQSTVGGGRPKKPDTTPLQEMKLAAETYGLAANDIAEAMVNMSMDETIEPRFRFLFMKESNLRIFGQPKNSIEDVIRHVNDKIDKLYDLTMPLLEATAVGDGKALVRELLAQGKLGDVVKEIEGERNE